MSDQMISSGSATHSSSGLDVSGALTALKSQLNSITKILKAHGQELKQVEKLNTVYKEIRASLNLSDAAARRLVGNLKQLNNIQKLQSHTSKFTKGTGKNLIAVSKIQTRLFKQTAGITAKHKTWLNTTARILAAYQLIEQSAKRIAATNPSIKNIVAPAAKISRNASGGKSPMAGGPVSTPSTKGWASGLTTQLRYWTRLGLAYRVLGKLTKGMGTYVQMLETVNRAVRTSVKNVNDWNEVSIARSEIQQSAIQYLSKHSGSISEYTEAIHQLTQAEMERAEALKLAPTVMALSAAADAPIKETTRLLVGLNELFKKNLISKGLTTDTERIQKIASVMVRAVKLEITTIEQLTKSLAYVAPIGLKANMSIEELVATISMLNSNLLQSSKAGTGMRQMINALVKKASRCFEFLWRSWCSGSFNYCRPDWRV